MGDRKGMNTRLWGFGRGRHLGVAITLELMAEFSLELLMAWDLACHASGWYGG